ncbi:MAG: DUF5675 family protein [Nitrososphaera sp.]
MFEIYIGTSVRTVIAKWNLLHSKLRHFAKGVSALFAKWLVALRLSPQESRGLGVISLESNQVTQRIPSFAEDTMQLILQRYDRNEFRIIGKLYMDGRFFCWTLEDPENPPEGKGAIPLGTYQVIVNHSPRFNRLLPLLMNVPGFEGIRIHIGNVIADTAGCILVADKRDVNSLIQSRQALERLMQLISMPCWITITEDESVGKKEEEKAS